MLGIVLTQAAHLENPEGAAWKPQTTQKRCHVHILEAENSHQLEGQPRSVCCRGMKFATHSLGTSRCSGEVAYNLRYISDAGLGA